MISQQEKKKKQQISQSSQRYTLSPLTLIVSKVFSWKEQQNVKIFIGKIYILKHKLLSKTSRKTFIHYWNLYSRYVFYAHRHILHLTDRIYTDKILQIEQFIEMNNPLNKLWLLQCRFFRRRCQTFSSSSVWYLKINCLTLPRVTNFNDITFGVRELSQHCVGYFYIIINEEDLRKCLGGFDNYRHSYSFPFFTRDFKFGQDILKINE